MEINLVLNAVQAMNESNTSSDFLFNCELAGGIDASSTRRLILPSVQVNMRAGQLPEPEANGTRYIKIPLNAV